MSDVKEQYTLDDHIKALEALKAYHESSAQLLAAQIKWCKAGKPFMDMAMGGPNLFASFFSGKS